MGVPGAVRLELYDVPGVRPLRAAGRLPRVRVAAGAHAWETDELAWVPATQVHARDLHPAFASAWPALRERIEAVARLSA